MVLENILKSSVLSSHRDSFYATIEALNYRDAVRVISQLSLCALMRGCVLCAETQTRRFGETPVAVKRRRLTGGARPRVKARKRGA
jgi:hypothetical protein